MAFKLTGRDRPGLWRHQPTRVFLIIAAVLICLLWLSTSDSASNSQPPGFLEDTPPWVSGPGEPERPNRRPEYKAEHRPSRPSITKPDEHAKEEPQSEQDDTSKATEKYKFDSSQPHQHGHPQVDTSKPKFDPELGYNGNHGEQAHRPANIDKDKDVPVGYNGKVAGSGDGTPPGSTEEAGDNHETGTDHDDDPVDNHGIEGEAAHDQVDDNNDNAADGETAPKEEVSGEGLGEEPEEGEGQEGQENNEDAEDDTEEKDDDYVDPPAGHKPPSAEHEPTSSAANEGDESNDADIDEEDGEDHEDYVDPPESGSRPPSLKDHEDYEEPNIASTGSKHVVHGDETSDSTDDGTFDPDGNFPQGDYEAEDSGGRRLDDDWRPHGFGDHKDVSSDA